MLVFYCFVAWFDRLLIASLLAACDFTLGVCLLMFPLLLLLSLTWVCGVVDVCLLFSLLCTD